MHIKELVLNFFFYFIASCLDLISQSELIYCGNIFTVSISLAQLSTIKQLYCMTDASTTYYRRILYAECVMRIF